MILLVSRSAGFLSPLYFLLKFDWVFLQVVWYTVCVKIPYFFIFYESCRALKHTYLPTDLKKMSRGLEVENSCQRRSEAKIGPEEGGDANEVRLIVASALTCKDE